MSPTSQRLSTKRMSKGCWTCKVRKIGRDKTPPSCNNCARTKRCCEGYGVKLHWPESADGRRPVHAWDSLPHQQRVETHFPHNCSNVYFFNTTNDDMKCVTIDAWTHNTRGNGMSSIERSLEYGYEVDSSTDDNQLLSYYHGVLSGMITTIDDDQNGFRSILLPNALSHQSLASQSLHEAILALSALHLQDRIHSGQRETGTCMMLCVCDVFDAVDGSWYSHMHAANTISRSMLAQYTPSDSTAHFLISWLTYHKVLSEFSCPPDQPSTQIGSLKVPVTEAHNQVIIGSLGCSMQVLECISCINHLARTIDQHPLKALSPEMSLIAEQLESQLDTLQQVPRIVHEGISRQIDEARIINTAELYRISTHVYLCQTVSNNSEDNSRLRHLVSEALLVLKKLVICTSPWPLFIIACEIATDEERIIILDILVKMQTVRRIGNVAIMRNIIKAVWKRTDLNAMSQMGVRFIWKDLIDAKLQRPSFI
ncbi:hypothetical protein VTL71DRAFT_1339 [Oculimacula yallundae]|uniref:Zn(2)-C6 fungal-type domain-containing protein n=1 Tax=Oculimacula yallundae TaxID=86028 RepID=A0ABR4CAE5_9HELO